MEMVLSAMRLITLLKISAMLGFVSSHLVAQDELGILYPEEIFPELRPLLESAAKNAPELRARAATVEERAGQAIVQASQRNSTLRLNSRVLGGYEYRFGSDIDNDSSNGTQTGRSLATIDGSLWWEKPIFAWGNLERYARIGELGVEAAKLDFAESTRVHLNEVRATFLRWQVATQQLQLLEENVVVAQQIVDAQRQLFKSGRTSEQRVLELEARLLETEESRALFIREQQYFRNRLGVLVGNDALVDTVSQVVTPQFVLPEGAALADWSSRLGSSISSRPALERERRYAQIDATQAEVVARNQRPTLDLVAGLVSDRLDSAESDVSDFRVISYVGLQLRWNIFDGRRSEGEQIAALARKRSREANLVAAEARVMDEGARLAANLRYQLAQSESRTRRAELLERRLELASNPGGEDRISPLDQLELRLEYLSAEQRVLESKADYLMTMTQLAALVFVDPVAGL